MDSNDLALVAQQIREMMTRVAALDTKQAIPEFDQKLASVVEQMESLKALVSAAPPAVPQDDEVEPALPQPESVAKPADVSMEAFAAEKSPPAGDVQTLIASLFSGAETSSAEVEALDEDGSVWKLDWSGVPDPSKLGSGIRPPTKPAPADPKPGAKPSRELWDDLSEQGS